MNIKEIKIIIKHNKEGFELIKPLWEKYLWPNRKTEIKSHSSMTYEQSYDMSIYNNLATYWFLIYKEQIIGCNSGFRTKEKQYRSRGIWIDKKFRGQSLSSLLFTLLFEQAKCEGCDQIWSIPRKHALSSYLTVGFEQTSDFRDYIKERGR